MEKKRQAVVDQSRMKKKGAVVIQTVKTLPQKIKIWLPVLRQNLLVTKKEDIMSKVRCILVALCILYVGIPYAAKAQSPQINMPGAAGEKEHVAASNSQPLSSQIEALRLRVSGLEAKLETQGVDTAAMTANGAERRSQMTMGATGNNSQPQNIPPSVQVGTAAQAPEMGMMAGMMSMMNTMMGGMGGGAAPMGQSAGMGANGLVSALPGFPGSSHLYHIGATNFFLDHPEHITLSFEQQNRLGEIRMRSALGRSEFNRKIQVAEEQLWFLTAADQPNYSLIEAKVRESENLQGDLRLAFIKDVGEAATLLTDGQRRALLGQIAAVGAPTDTGISKPHVP